MTPNSLFMLRSMYSRFGKDENEKSCSVPCIPELVRFILVILPAALHEIPVQKHRLAFAFGFLEELVALLLGR